VLIRIEKDPSQKSEWTRILGVIATFESFEFVFHPHLMLVVLGYTNELSISLQRRDQDIRNAMGHVELPKDKMKQMRSHGWKGFLAKVYCFLRHMEFKFPHRNKIYVTHGRSH
jgi:hypothetical protein